ncbi:hypothetical protein MLD38_025536 [Melastoma candidum]|uniref:Uncharacterized protein n=1 Tax=Melastoma candidum TaxID=119954 RepID=A0ACB9P0U9_9MYRT|nr:hypothetical protein MLD38_025536 [Melastoma candidum]
MDADTVVKRAVSSLGKGFDLTYDFRLKYCKGDDRLILLDESQKRTLLLPGLGTIHDVPLDIGCDKGDCIRYQSDILQFSKMSEFFNQKSSVSGRIPSGLFNAMFGFQSSSWGSDAANNKSLGIDGYFIVLCNFRIDRRPLALSNRVIEAVPTSWDPPALARFIEKYGTHVINGLGIGGQDMVMVRQDKTSKLAAAELKKHMDELGDQLFTGSCTFSPEIYKSKYKAPEAFSVLAPQPLPFSHLSTSCCSKDGITVICSRRGGDLSADTHSEWLLTVPSKPDTIHFTFTPITSLLKGVPGNGFLSHAINLYLRYKPPINELQYFLDFQTHKTWSPIHNDQPLGPTTNRTISPSLSLNYMGPKLYINTTQVTVGKRPVTGMRLFLEGMKCNRLGIHLHHLSLATTMLEHRISEAMQWRGSEEITQDAYYEPIQGKKFSHICVAPVEFERHHYSHSFTLKTDSTSSAYIVTGAQLHVKKHGSRDVLHLRLQFTNVSDCIIAQSSWDRGREQSQKSGLFSALSTPITLGGSNSNGSSSEKDKSTAATVNIDSAVYPTGPPVPVQTPKLLKLVDTSQRCRGPQHSPGHWLVTGAKLDLENGKICIHVKFSLLSVKNRNT